MVTEKSETLLAQLKKVMEQEKEHVACKSTFRLFALVKVYNILLLFTSMLLAFVYLMSDRRFGLELLKIILLQKNTIYFKCRLCLNAINSKCSLFCRIPLIKCHYFYFFPFSRSQPSPFDQLLPVQSGCARPLCERHQGQQPCHPQAH